MDRFPTHRRVGGFGLIEVMIAVVVLSFGLLALAALQAGLFRAGAETKARANATTIAQQIVEDAKTFAYLVPPAGYPASASTYQGLDTADLGATTVGGVTYTVCRKVIRYRYDTATAKFVAFNTVSATACTGNAAGAVDPGVPEFKEVRALVSWTGNDGVDKKSVEVSDTVAAIAPSDATQVVRGPLATGRGPEVWIEPPNKANPQVVPIAIGDDQSAASSNPKPQQFVQDVSAATLFSVLTFSGTKDTDALEVKLNRKVDIAAVSCVCEADGKSTVSNPSFLPTVWNGKQRAYLTPLTSGVGTNIGKPVLSSSTPEIASMCTVCCRDHHETAAGNPRVDPWRALTATEKSAGEEHYGYAASSGKGYDLSVLQPLGAATSNRYIDSCQLVRVNGRMRVGIDAQQANLLVTPVDGTAYKVPDFITHYSDFVNKTVSDGITALPAGYAAPNARFARTTVPGTSNLRLTSPVALSDTSQQKLIAFGLYVDYLSPDTIEAYTCASQPADVSGSCAGLGGRNPLETIPFYAVNVANLGEWRSFIPQAVTAKNTTYDSKGLISSDGGLVLANTSATGQTLPVTLRINNSNSGLASVFPVDPDDSDSDSNFYEDYQNFSRTGGSTGDKAYSITLKVVIADSTNLSKYNFEQSDKKIVCEGRFSVVCTISYSASKPLDSAIVINNYNSSNADLTVNDRLICVADQATGKAVTTTVAGSGLSESTTLNVHDDTVTVGLAVIDATSCPTGYH